MVEIQPIIWTTIGIIVGALPAVLLAFWRECRERRIQKDQLARRQRQVRREIIEKGIKRGYEVELTQDSQSIRPPRTP